MAEDPKPEGLPKFEGGQQQDPQPPEHPFQAAPSPNSTPETSLSPPKSPQKDPPETGDSFLHSGGGGGVPKIAFWGRPRRPPARTRLRNRRYAALRQLIQAGDYFSEEQMRSRDPLLYQHYIGQYQGMESTQGGGPQNLPFEAPTPKFPGGPPPESLSGLLLRSLEEAFLQQRLAQQRLQDGDSDEEEDPKPPPEQAELEMLRQEFTTRMHQRFLDGQDPDFDYSQIDADPELDNLDLVSQDAEERYFDEEEPSAAPQLD